jgi:hypothetical protein
MEPISDRELLVAGIVVLAVVYALAELRRRLRDVTMHAERPRRRRRKASRAARPRRSGKPSRPAGFKKGKPIVVDGSNVMYWGGDPSDAVLRGVINNLKSRGFYPFVIFDANVGYILADCYLDAAAMSQKCGVPKTRIEIVDKGVVADEVILKYAKRHGVPVVSNDRSRDWSIKFPLVKKKDRMMRGTWKGGNVVWRRQ